VEQILWVALWISLQQRANSFVSTVQSGEVFPGQDPIYDDLVAALDSVQSMAARINPSSSLGTAGTPRTAGSFKQASLETEMILLKAQLYRQQKEITCLKESNQGKVLQTVSYYPRPS
jgi:hypothetical protein